MTEQISDTSNVHNAWNQPVSEDVIRHELSRSTIPRSLLQRQADLASPAIGMIWLGCIFAVVAVLMPLTIWFVNEFLTEILSGRFEFWFVMAISQAFFLPSLISGSFAVAIPMLVNRSVTLRFLMANIIVAPGLLLCSVCFAVTDGWPPVEFYLVIGGFMATVSIASLCAQFWMRRSLVHKSWTEPSRPLGILSLMELTVLVSLFMVVAMANKDLIPLEGTIVVIGVGSLAWLFAYLCCYAYLSETIRWRFSLLVTGLIAWLLSGTMVSLVSGFEFGTQDLLRNLHWIALVSLVGAASTCVIFSLVFWSLRYNGWRLVRSHQNAPPTVSSPTESKQETP
ncbi:hypothetical protein [Stieleria varia]|nr:hypothetical protein [Stieleria varia]